MPEHQKQPQQSSSFLYKPLVEDTDMQPVNRADNSAPDNEESTRSPQPDKEVERLVLDSDTQQFIIKADDFMPDPETRITGNSVTDLKTQLSRKIMILGKPTVLYLQINGNTTEKYLSIQLNDKDSKTYLLNHVYPKEISVTDENGESKTVTQYNRFELYTDHHATENKARSFDISSLKDGTTKDAIIAQFNPNQQAKVEHVSVYRQKHGGLMSATIVFSNEEPIKTMKENNTAVVFIGTDSGRITRLGNDDMTYPKDWVVKLTNLRKGTTPLTLKKGLCERTGHCSVTIPFRYNSNIRKREAFVSFTNKEAFEKQTAKDFYLEEDKLHLMKWVDVDTKCCNQCGAHDHLIVACPEMAWQREAIQRKRVIARPQRAPAPPTTEKKRYLGAVPQAQTGVAPTLIGPAFSTMAKQGQQKNTQQETGTKPNQVSMTKQQPSYEDLLLRIEKQDAVIKQLQNSNAIRGAEETRGKKEAEKIAIEEKINDKTLEDKIATAVARALSATVSEAVKNAMEPMAYHMQFDMFKAFKMFKESITDSEEEEKIRKRKVTRATSAVNVDEQKKNTQGGYPAVFDTFQNFRNTMQWMNQEIDAGSQAATANGTNGEGPLDQSGNLQTTSHNIQ
jgi:hypothetical protein